MEVSSKKKRGRPQVHFPELYGSLVDARTRRGRIEQALSFHPWGVIKEFYESNGAEKWCEFYIDPDKKVLFHTSILAALGRIDDDDALLDIARRIAVGNVSTRRPVAYIRRWRTGKWVEPDHLKFVMHLARAVRAIRSAIRVATRAVEHRLNTHIKDELGKVNADDAS